MRYNLCRYKMPPEVKIMKKINYKGIGTAPVTPLTRTEESAYRNLLKCMEKVGIRV